MTVDEAITEIRDHYVMGCAEDQVVLVAARVMLTEFERIESAWNRLRSAVAEDPHLVRLMEHLEEE